jgi:hypothetical protein
MVEGDTAETVAARAKIQLITAGWETIRATINNGASIPVDARREVILGYHYALHRQAHQLEKEKCEIKRRVQTQQCVSVASRQCSKKSFLSRAQ